MATTTIYIPRVLGGTLILTVQTQAPVTQAVHSLPLYGRDGTSVLHGRNGNTILKSRS